MIFYRSINFPLTTDSNLLKTTWKANWHLIDEIEHKLIKKNK